MVGVAHHFLCFSIINNGTIIIPFGHRIEKMHFEYENEYILSINNTMLGISFILNVHLTILFL